jgi:PTH1 family peptidyl-tRNA hydrolase
VKDSIQLIVGLGNPGPEYEQTRHNAGVQCLEALVNAFNIPLKPEKKFFGYAGKGRIGQQEVWCLFPTTYMNRSGQSVAALAQFYKIPPQNILIIHDELDLPAGIAKFKQGGGHGGQNGLKDIIKSLGNQNSFYRLRIGIGHPGDKHLVTQYVLGKAPKVQAQQIAGAIESAIQELPSAIAGDWANAMNRLHSIQA